MDKFLRGAGNWLGELLRGWASYGATGRYMPPEQRTPEELGKQKTVAERIVEEVAKKAVPPAVRPLISPVAPPPPIISPVIEPPDTELQMLEKMGGSRNPVQEERYRQLKREQEQRQGAVLGAGRTPSAPTPPPTPTGEAQVPPPTEQPKSPEEKLYEGLLTAVQAVLQTAAGKTGVELDVELAKQAAVQAFAPYYTQTLQDFMRGIEIQKKRGGEATQRLIQELQAGTEYYTGAAQRLLEQAQERTGEAYAGRGLFESGARRRATGLLEIERGKELQRFLGGQERKELGAGEQLRQLLEDIGIEEAQKRREIAGEQARTVGEEVERARLEAAETSRILGQPVPTDIGGLEDYFKKRSQAMGRFVSAY